jgi:GTPase SAR1 family protein
MGNAGSAPANSHRTDTHPNRRLKLKDNIKVVIVGPENSGKSSVCERFTRGGFSGDLEPTRGVSYCTKRVFLGVGETGNNSENHGDGSGEDGGSVEGEHSGEFNEEIRLRFAEEIAAAVSPGRFFLAPCGLPTGVNRAVWGNLGDALLEGVSGGSSELEICDVSGRKLYSSLADANGAEVVLVCFDANSHSSWEHALKQTKEMLASKVPIVVAANRIDELSGAVGDDDKKPVDWVAVDRALDKAREKSRGRQTLPLVFTSSVWDINVDLLFVLATLIGSGHQLPAGVLDAAAAALPPTKSALKT